MPKTVDDEYIAAVPGRSFANQALASVLSIVRAVSVPLGITTPNTPNIASTIWRTVADSKNRIYYFDSATSPNIFWVELDGLNFEKGAPVQRLEVAGGKIYSGNMAKAFQPNAMLQWLAAEPAVKK